MTQPLRVAFVVATKDRPGELARMWDSLRRQTRPPDEVVIVDASTKGDMPPRLDPGPIRLKWLRAEAPSASRQRNQGLAAVGPGADLVGFLDDDAVIEPEGLERMMTFWSSADARVGGAAFAMRNHPVPAWTVLKRTPLAENAGLYSRRRGTVTAAGFQTMIGVPDGTEFADWLPSGACLWRREVFTRFRFDEWFRGYSYLEDLDFSYSVGKHYRLAVVADAGYFHYPAAEGRGNGYEFGVREVLNRVYFVRKNPELSLFKCYLALALRCLMSVTSGFREQRPGYFLRAFGNVIGMARSSLVRLRSGNGSRVGGIA
jgi:GT2 family glycosyltransferase